ncbi:MAG TPA: hypothetical protein H9815_20110 [Candidatus Ruania gallistercoris]|uniref:Fibronectin type-III domain-containing protein n=1 Tax=Candidatus Ruania gallistercoris TaxID=2838746 RepID=A0A9D2EIY7_9MICO|nr:hypothetical protein [Candidatus Ruania gallistercoris]
MTSAVVIPAVDTSSAAFTDAEHAAVSMAAAELAAPQARDCQLRPLPPLASTSATLRWQPPSAPPAEYSYEWQILNSSGDVLTSGNYPATTTEHQVNASAIGIATTRTFQVRVVDGNWESAWITGQVTTLLDLLGIALIGSCSWQ